MATSKSKAESSGRSREILGVGLLGISLFSLVSVVSMQAGNTRVMGPGGAAAAAGIYSLTGIASYIFIGACLVVAVRLCRGKAVIDGLLEPVGFVLLGLSVAVLCHLPFADGEVLLRGPGGLLGQYVGQAVAAFIGPVGAALAATTLLCTAILLLTDIRVAEVIDSLAWAGRHVGRGLWWTARQAGRGILAASRALGRMVVAMFPDKSASEVAAEEREPDETMEELAEEPVPVIAASLGRRMGRRGRRTSRRGSRRWSRRGRRGGHARPRTGPDGRRGSSRSKRARRRSRSARASRRRRTCPRSLPSAGRERGAPGGGRGGRRGGGGRVRGHGRGGQGQGARGHG